MTVSESDEVLELFSALEGLHQGYWRMYRDPASDRMVVPLRQALTEVMKMAVEGVLKEMQHKISDPHVQMTGIFLLRSVTDSNASAKHIVESSGGVQVLVRIMTQHFAAEHVLKESLSLLDELQGLPSLLQALEHLRPSAAATKAVLNTLRSTTRSRWSEVEEFPSEALVKSLLASMQAHQKDPELISSGLQILGDVASCCETVRTTFANCGGWAWLMSIMDSMSECAEVQQTGVRLLAQLCRGGAFTEAHSVRLNALLERVMQQHQNDERVIYWGLWAVQQLQGACSLLATLRDGCNSRNPHVITSSLRSMSGISWGQGDGAGPQQAAAVIEATLQAMKSNQDNDDVLVEGTVVLGRAAAFCAEKEDIQAAVQAGSASIAALLEVLRLKVSSEILVKPLIEALAEILSSASPSSSLRRQVCDGLFQDFANGHHPNGNGIIGHGLLSKVSAQHESSCFFSGLIMWLAGLARGARAVVQEMELQPSSYAVQMSAIRALATLYGDNVDNEASDENYATRSSSLEGVLRAMTSFSENMVLLQNACFALSTIVEHGMDNVVDEAKLLMCLQAAVQSLKMAHEKCEDADKHPGYYVSSHVAYLRMESVRLIASVCGVCPRVGPWLHQQDIYVYISAALIAAAGKCVDGSRDEKVEEVVQLQLLALAYIVSPTEAVAGSLRRWGTSKQSIAFAAADAVSELIRRAHPPVVKDLSQGIVSAELSNMMRVHSADADLQQRLNLAMGFLNQNVTT